MQFLSFLLFTGLVALITYFFTHKKEDTTEEGYFLGGRSLSGVVIAGSLLLTNLSTEQIVGLNGASYREGILVAAWEVLAAVAIMITAVYLLPRYLKLGIATIPQFLEDRFDTATKSLTSAIFLAGYGLIFLPIVLYSGALALSTMFHVADVFDISETLALWLTVWTIGIVGSIYAIFGGLRAVAVSDTLNAIGLFTGGLLIPVFGLMAIGDGDPIGGMKELFWQQRDKFHMVGGPQSALPFGTLFTGMMLVQLFYWGTNQAIIQRALAAKNLKQGQLGLFLAALGKIFVPFIVVLPGVIAYHYFGGHLDNPDQAYPMLVNEVLPPMFAGFFAAVIFGAILSSFNSALNSAVTLFGLDIYKTYLKKDATEEQVVRVGKTFGVFLALMAMFVAPLIARAPQGLFSYLQEVNGCYNIPILTIIVVGFMTRYVPALAAKIGLLSGVVLYSISQFVIKPLVGSEHYLHYLHVMAILFVFNTVLMIVIGKIWPRSEPYKLRYTHKVDIRPWKIIYPAAVFIFLVVISIYIILK